MRLNRALILMKCHFAVSHSPNTGLLPFQYSQDTPPQYATLGTPLTPQYASPVRYIGNATALTPTATVHHDVNRHRSNPV